MLSLEEMAVQLRDEKLEMTTLEYQTLMVHHMIQFGKVSKEIEGIKERLATNDKRLEALEKKIGDESEFPIPRTITIQNLAPHDAHDDLEIAKCVIEKMNVEGVTCESVLRAARKGYKPEIGTQKARNGTVLVELSSKDAKLKVLRSKKMLAHSDSPEMRIMRIDSMKTAEQLNQDHFNRQMLKMTHGGDQFYIAGSGALRPSTHPAPTSRFQGPPPTPRTYAGATRPYGAPHGSQHPASQSQRLPPPLSAAPLSQPPPAAAPLSQPPPLRPTGAQHLDLSRTRTLDFMTRH